MSSAKEVVQMSRRNGAVEFWYFSFTILIILLLSNFFPSKAMSPGLFPGVYLSIQFTIYCFQLMHLTYIASENLTECSAFGSGLYSAQCFGMLRLLDNRIAQLCNTGLYDNAAIIMANHGNTDQGTGEGTASAALFIKQKNEKHSEMQRVHTPADHECFIPTIVKAIEPKCTAEFGVPFDKATPDIAPLLLYIRRATKRTASKYMLKTIAAMSATRSARAGIFRRKTPCTVSPSLLSML